MIASSLESSSFCRRESSVFLLLSSYLMRTVSFSRPSVCLSNDSIVLFCLLRKKDSSLFILVCSFSFTFSLDSISVIRLLSSLISLFFSYSSFPVRSSFYLVFSFNLLISSTSCLKLSIFLFFSSTILPKSFI
jgi:hypothetical protein